MWYIKGHAMNPCISQMPCLKGQENNLYFYNGSYCIIPEYDLCIIN